ncbi:MAG: hypothetical protein KGJ07_08860, partial [Patescibacteria group bacterium]|nr:hypothetical protein [Patescibacteria group bacterium]
MPQTESPRGQEPNPAIGSLVSALMGSHSRRKFLQRGAIAGTLAAAASIGLIKWRLPNFADNPIGSIQEVKQVSERIDAFLKAPKPQDLLAQAYRCGESFYFSPEELGHVSLYLFGDSMNLLDGTRIPSDGTQQKGSWGEIAASDMNTLLNQRGIPGKWNYFNYAIPGSSTVGLVGDESYDHNAQLGKLEVQNQIVNDPNIPIVAIGLNGNNWKKTAEFAIDLYHNSPNFKTLLDTLDMSNQNFAQQLATKGEQLITLLNDPQLRHDLNQLMDYFDADSKTFREGFESSLRIVRDLNQKRKLSNPSKPEIRLAVTLPIDMALRDVVPYAPSNAPRGERGQFDYGDIPIGKEAVYKVTSTIYTTASNLLRQY